MQNKIVFRKNNPIPFFRKSLGLFLGLTYSFCIYAFFIVLRESFRYFTITKEYEIWILTDEEVFVSNWNIAAIALIMGQSICLTHWFEHPKKYRIGNSRNRTTILNDQRFLQSNFLMWGVKLTFISVVICSSFWANNYLLLSFQDTFGIFMILLLLVLFFQSWNTIRLKYKTNSFKWMLRSFFILLGLSIGLANVDIIDYQAINKSVLRLNMQYSYDLQLPKVDHYDEDTYTENSFHPSIYLAIDPKDEANLVLKEEDNIHFLEKENFSQDIKNILTSHWYDKKNRVEASNIKLYIDKRIEMQYIHLIWDELRSHNYINTHYPVQPKNNNDSLYINGEICYSEVVPMNSDMDIHVYFNRYAEKTKNIVQKVFIYHNQPDQYLINNQKVNSSDLFEELTKLLFNDTEFIIYKVADDLPFGDYLQFKTTLNTVMNEFNETKASTSYQSLSNSQQREMEKKNPPINFIHQY